MIFLTSIILNNSIFSTAVLFKHVRILEHSKETTTMYFSFPKKQKLDRYNYEPTTTEGRLK